MLTNDSLGCHFVNTSKFYQPKTTDTHVKECQGFLWEMKPGLYLYRISTDFDRDAYCVHMCLIT